MLFNARNNRKYTTPEEQVIPSWLLAWGKVDNLKQNVAWQDEQIAFIPVVSSAITNCNTDKFALSPNQQFVVVGDVWLSNRVELLKKLGIEAANFSESDKQIDVQLDLKLDIQLDVQLIANLWERWGEECLNMLEGMFGLVIWDRKQQILRLIRDRTGARTLYYTNTGSTRWIAPKLRTLTPHHSREIDLIALRDYLCCAFVPGDRTLWQDVREIRPGTCVQFPNEKVYSYWQLQENITDDDKPLVWHSDLLRDLLEQVVREYLPENEPVGVFLSGGLDSSSITALAAKLHNAPIHTFSIHFGPECANELEFSSLVAEHCQTQHHILEITLRDMWEKLPEAMAYLDDPIGDPLTVPNLLVGKLARDYVKTTLNGEGGDPCFGGPKNQPMLINNLYGSVTNQDPLQAYLISFQKCAIDLPQLLNPEVLQALKTVPHVFSQDLNSDASYLNKLMALNIKFKGADQILTKVNNLTQATGLEGLSPLFDQRVVDLSMKIPPKYKLSGVEEKAVLKQAVSDILPEIIINRPKSGMMVPVQLGFKKYWLREARHLLLNKKAAISPYINQSIIRDWLDYRGDIWGRYGVKLWLLVSLEIWLQVNKKL